MNYITFYIFKGLITMYNKCIICKKNTDTRKCNKCNCSMCNYHTIVPIPQLRNNKLLISYDLFNREIKYGYINNENEYRWICDNCYYQSYKY
jgi:hypothetical protein